MENIMVTDKTAREGMRVRRGRDWKWSNQDHVDGKQVSGVITRVGEGWVTVQWDGGSKNGYQTGNKDGTGVFDLYEEVLSEPVKTQTKEISMGKVIITEMLATVGMRVHRGRDWPSHYDCQDRYGGITSGKITGGEIKEVAGKVCSVIWDGRPSSGPWWYNIGHADKYELYFGEPEAQAEPEPIVSKPTCVYNGRNNFTTWQFEKHSQPMQVGDELMCVVDATYVKIGHVVVVTEATLSWSDSSGPTVSAKTHDGKTQSYYLKRYVPFGKTAERFGFVDTTGISPIHPKGKSGYPIKSGSYMDWGPLKSKDNPIRIGDILVNVNGAGNEGDLWIATTEVYDDGYEWMVRVKRINNQDPSAIGDVYYLKRFAPYGDLAARIGYSGTHKVINHGEIEVGDKVRCINDSKQYVEYSRMKLGDMYTVSEVGSGFLRFYETTPVPIVYLEKECFVLYQKKGTFTPSSNSQTIKTNTDVTDTNTGSAEALKVQRPSCLLARAGGYSTNPVQGRRSKAKLG